MLWFLSQDCGVSPSTSYPVSNVILRPNSSKSKVKPKFSVSNVKVELILAKHLKCLKAMPTHESFQLIYKE